jgi:hypothetical protein
MNTQIIPVPFYDDILVLTGKDNEPFVAMKPVVENMGLAWQAQQRKLTDKFGSVITIMITTGADGKNYEMTCLPLRKLAAWLYSINPGKLAPELRDKVSRYQNECDDVLWNYWTKGSATRPGAMTLTERLRAHKARLDCLNQLEAATNALKRKAIHEQLSEISQMLGYEAPPIDAIGSTEPDEPACITEFWDAITELNNLHVPTNHARDSSLIAINLPEIMRLATEHKLPLASSSEIRKKIPLSKQARFLRNTCVNSVLTNQSVKCYVFEAKTEEMAQ